jgi:hypothetical protein
MINNKKYDNFSNVLELYLLMMTLLLCFFFQKPVVIVLCVFLCAIYVLFKNWPIRILKSEMSYFLYACLLFIPAFLKPYHGFSPIFYFLSTIILFYTAKTTSIYTPRVFLKAFQLVYGFSIIAIGLILYKYWGYPEPFGMVIEGSSTNGIPSYLIVIQIGLSLSSFVTKRSLPIISTFLTGTVAFYGNGRGSLVVAGIIILFTLISNLYLFGESDRKKQLIYLVVFVFAIVSIIPDVEYLIDSLFVYTKLSVGLDDQNRIEILEEYMGKIDFYTFFFGASYEGTVIEYKMAGNPHISYIRTHSFFGLPLTIIAAVSPLFVLFYTKKFADKFVFIVFIALAAFRAASEPILFPTLLDYFYFTFFFLFYKYAKT